MLFFFLIIFLFFTFTQKRREERDQVAHTLCSVCGGVMPRERITGHKTPLQDAVPEESSFGKRACFL